MNTYDYFYDGYGGEYFMEYGLLLCFFLVDNNLKC